MSNWMPQAFIPRELLRSAVFCACRRCNAADRVDLDAVPVRAQTGVEIVRSGPELEQDDLDVLIALLEMWWIEQGVRRLAIQSRELPADYDINDFVETWYTDLGRQLGIEKLNSRGYTELRESIRRLSQQHYSGRVLKADGNIDYTIDYKLISTVVYDEHVFWAPDLLFLGRLKEKRGQVLSLRKRRRLRGGVARWLSAYLSTHSESQPIPLSTLRLISGYKGAQKEFNREVRNSKVKLAQLAGLQVGLDGKWLTWTKGRG